MKLRRLAASLSLKREIYERRLLTSALAAVEAAVVTTRRKPQGADVAPRVLCGVAATAVEGAQQRVAATGERVLCPAAVDARPMLAVLIVDDTAGPRIERRYNRCSLRLITILRIDGGSCPSCSQAGARRDRL